MKKPLFFALICGVLATLFTALYLTALENSYRKGAEKVNVIVAKQYIDQGATLTPELLEEKAIPKEYLQPRAARSIKDLADAEGRSGYIALLPIEKGEQIAMTKLSVLGVDTGISSVIPTGKRALTLVFDGDEIAGIVKPGNHADIIGVFEYRDKEGRSQEESIPVLQDVLVLSVGQSYLGGMQTLSRKDKDRASFVEPGTGKIPVSFAVSPDQGAILSLAAEKGRIKLSLRPIGDDGIYEARKARIQDFSKDIITTAQADKPAMSEEYVKEMQKKQKEALEILKRYRK